MEELNVTASAVISFAEKLEDTSSELYEELAERFAAHKKTFLAFAKESRKNKVLVTRTYQETITDALEACFSFAGLNLNDYAVQKVSVKGMNYPDALQMAVELEERASHFYLDVAKRCHSLLATIPGAFRRVAEVRNKRKLKLQSLLKQGH